MYLHDDGDTDEAYTGAIKCGKVEAMAAFFSPPFIIVLMASMAFAAGD